MLDLKFVVHCGPYAAHVVAGREELVGYDVILVHRLLKNQVADAIGTRGGQIGTACRTTEVGGVVARAAGSGREGDTNEGHSPRRDWARR